MSLNSASFMDHWTLLQVQIPAVRLSRGTPTAEPPFSNDFSLMELEMPSPANLRLQVNDRSYIFELRSIRSGTKRPQAQMEILY